MDAELRRRLAEFVESVLSGQISAAAALDQIEAWPPSSWADRDMSDVYHALVHYREDEDIRARDKDYEQAQYRWLLGFLQRLRDAPPTSNDVTRR